MLQGSTGSSLVGKGTASGLLSVVGSSKHRQMALWPSHSCACTPVLALLCLRSCACPPVLRRCTPALCHGRIVDFIATLFDLSSDSLRTLFGLSSDSLRTLFALSSHSLRTLFALSSHSLRTLFALSSHSLRTLFVCASILSARVDFLILCILKLVQPVDFST
jgi:hypothetical protein